MDQKAQFYELKAPLADLYFPLQSVNNELDCTADIERRELLVWEELLKLRLAHEVLDVFDFKVAVLEPVNFYREQLWNEKALAKEDWLAASGAKVILKSSL